MGGCFNITVYCNACNRLATDREGLVGSAALPWCIGSLAAKAGRCTTGRIEYETFARGLQSEFTVADSEIQTRQVI